ncbi:acetylxylan esterase [Falsibacillus pallidus]|uniref:Cephalosporin-C deacetylase n=1 Tax=Falsibacillus pallidus TaxID=493781 RepID=A0A370GAI3_9BACI|nr:acetylxylan esterase [Falsibacillus pallidus]RDI40049.1 cephalosporin-C deacetylase [Falsibacillus pallidus]
MGRHVGDFPLEELKGYRPELMNKPNDFDEFWKRKKEEINHLEPIVKMELRDFPHPGIEVYDVVFTSWDGTPLNGMLMKPVGAAKCPLIFHFHGYTGHRGFPLDYLKFTSLGAAVLAYDVRGQGNSPDYARYSNGSRVQGWMLDGIFEPENYYYTNVYCDILMQWKWLKSDAFPFKPTSIGLCGGSQGGGLALAAAGLVKCADFVIADYPFLAHFERAIDVALAGPYMEIVNFFKWHDPEYMKYDQVLKTLGYIDCVHFCEKVECPVMMSIGLEDAVTPPSTVFAAYNHVKSKGKSIDAYPQFTHEGNPFHDEKKLAFLLKHMK